VRSGIRSYVAVQSFATTSTRDMMPPVFPFDSFQRSYSPPPDSVTALPKEAHRD
jgi:hypothetical protein